MPVQSLLECNELGIAASLKGTRQARMQATNAEIRTMVDGIMTGAIDEAEVIPQGNRPNVIAIDSTDAPSQRPIQEKKSQN